LARPFSSTCGSVGCKSWLGRIDCAENALRLLFFGLIAGCLVSRAPGPPVPSGHQATRPSGHQAIKATRQSDAETLAFSPKKKPATAGVDRLTKTQRSL